MEMDIFNQLKLKKFKYDNIFLFSIVIVKVPFNILTEWSMEIVTFRVIFKNTIGNTVSIVDCI